MSCQVLESQTLHFMALSKVTGNGALIRSTYTIQLALHFEQDIEVGWDFEQDIEVGWDFEQEGNWYLGRRNILMHTMLSHASILNSLTTNSVCRSHHVSD